MPRCSHSSAIKKFSLFLLSLFVVRASPLPKKKKKNPIFSLSLSSSLHIIEEVSFLANTEGESINPQVRIREKSQRERERERERGKHRSFSFSFFLSRKKKSFSLLGRKNGTLIRTDAFLSLFYTRRHHFRSVFKKRIMAKYYPDIAKGAKGTRELRFWFVARAERERERDLSLSSPFLFF